MQTRWQEAQGAESEGGPAVLEVRREAKRAQREVVVRATVVPGSAPEHSSLVPIPLAELCGALTRREMFLTAVPAGAHVRRSGPAREEPVSVQKTRSNVGTAASTQIRTRQTAVAADWLADLTRSAQVEAVFRLVARSSRPARERA